MLILQACALLVIWVWLKIKQEGLRRFWSMFPFTRVPFWVPIFDPQPYVYARPCLTALVEACSPLAPAPLCQFYRSHEGSVRVKHTCIAKAFERRILAKEKYTCTLFCFRISSLGTAWHILGATVSWGLPGRHGVRNNLQQCLENLVRLKDRLIWVYGSATRLNQPRILSRICIALSEDPVAFYREQT